MNKIPIWKPLLVIGVLVVSALLLWASWPPRLGIDLAGGTRLIYEVYIPPEESSRADDILDEIIDVQKKRIDPNDTMRLVWRKATGNRIEIQMPLAPADTEVLRNTWYDAREALLAGNLDDEDIADAKLAAKTAEAQAARTAYFRELAGFKKNDAGEWVGGNTTLFDRLRELGEAYDALLAAATPYREKLEAQQAAKAALEQAAEAYDPAKEKFDEIAGEYDGLQTDLQRAQAALDAAMQRLADVKDLGPAEPGEGEDPAPLEEAFKEKVKQAEEVVAGAESRVSAALKAVEELKPGYEAAKAALEAAKPAWEKAKKAYDEAEEALIEAARQRNAAARAVTEARDAVLAENITHAQLMGVLKLNDERPAEPENARSPREQAVDEMLAQYPGRQEQIKAAVSAWDAYEDNRSLLDDPQDLVRLLRGAGVLEFRIVPHVGTLNDATVERLRRELRENGPQLRGVGRETGASEPDFVWREIDDLANDLTLRINEQGKPEKLNNPAERRALANDLVTRDPSESVEEYERELQQLFSAMYASRTEPRIPIVQPHEGKAYILVSNRAGEKMVSGGDDTWQVVGAGRTQDQRGYLAVSFKLDVSGARQMVTLTEDNQGNLMSIILDDKVMSFPRINDVLSSNIQISGGGSGFDPQEAQRLVRTLNAGSLAGRMDDEPISINKVSPTVGADRLARGLESAITALIVVAVFMMIYYFFAGAVANFALAANMLLIMMVMAVTGSAFTLPGIAGIVLTIGMAVDANVLIFERIREEMKRKSDLRTAVRLGYEKALSAIVDANITTLITCVVLYYTATAEVKGFALTLMIGVVSSLFTALFCTRVIVDYWVKFTDADKLSMLPTAVPAVGKLLNPKINWFGMRNVFFGASIVLVVASLFAIFYRGGDLMDIEFRSGTQVTFNLAPDVALSKTEADALLEAYAGDDKQRREFKPANAQVVGMGDETEGGKYTQFSIVVLDENSKRVGDGIKAAFAGKIPEVPSVKFFGSDMIRHTDAPEAVKVLDGPLTDVLQLSEAAERTFGVPDSYLGGVVVHMDDLSAPLTKAEVESRIETMRGKKPFSDYAGGFIEFRVYPIEQATAATEEAPATYTSFAAVFRDGYTDYRKTNMADRFDDDRAKETLSAMVWDITRTAMTEGDSLDSVTNFSSQVSRTMQVQAAEAMFLSLLAVVIYIWVRFGSLRYGIAAICALVHDVTIALGALAVSAFIYNSVGDVLGIAAFRIDLALVAAMLTIVGYSLNDTIVVFDRIRENKGKLAEPTPAIMNESLNQTISRTVLTSVTTLLALSVLYALGGGGSIHGFAFAMIIGVLVGTYSSVGVASPLILVFAPKAATSGETKTEPAPA